jgi:flagellar basal-body rod protein FlgB
MEPSSITDILYTQLNFRGERQKLIASNIANINTPEYKTKDMSFDDELEKAQLSNDLKLKTTHGTHITPLTDLSYGKINTFTVKGLQEQNDGNNVNLDTQMSDMAKNSIMFDAIQKSIKKDAMWLKEVIASAAKN